MSQTNNESHPFKPKLGLNISGGNVPRTIIFFCKTEYVNQVYCTALSSPVAGGFAARLQAALVTRYAIAIANATITDGYER